MRIVAAGFVPVLVGIAQLLSPKGPALGVPTPLLERAIGNLFLLSLSFFHLYGDSTVLVFMGLQATEKLTLSH